MHNFHYNVKYLYFNDSNFLCYIKIFITWFSRAIRVVKSVRQFVFKILYCIIILIQYGWRYYATFKVRKCESLFYKINTFFNYHFHWIASRANVLSKYVIYIFYNFGGGFCDSFPLLFPKAPFVFTKF